MYNDNMRTALVRISELARDSHSSEFAETLLRVQGLAESAINQLPPAPVAEELSRKPVASVEVYDGVLAGIYANELVEYLPDGETMLYTHPQPAVPDVDALAQHIRKIDGNNDMGAGALAEQICNWIEEQQSE